MNKLIVLLVLLVFVSIFAVMNAGNVNINFFFMNIEVSLALVIFVSALLGAIIAFIISLFDKFKKYKKVDAIKKALKECENRVEELELKLQENKKENEKDEIIQEQVE